MTFTKNRNKVHGGRMFLPIGMDHHKSHRAVLRPEKITKLPSASSHTAMAA